MYLPDTPAWREIVAEFGDEVLAADRTIDRRKLGPRVFADPAALQTLNRITHGKIFAYVQGQIDYIRRTAAAGRGGGGGPPCCWKPGGRPWPTGSGWSWRRLRPPSPGCATTEACRKTRRAPRIAAQMTNDERIAARRHRHSQRRRTRRAARRHHGGLAGSGPGTGIEHPLRFGRKEGHAKRRQDSGRSCGPLSIVPGVAKYAEGSALITMGDTQVRCTASVEESVPRFRRDSGRGWVSAEYAMLPARHPHAHAA